MTLNLSNTLRRIGGIKSDGFRHLWTLFWMRRAGLSRFGRFATRLATWFAPPHKAQTRLSRFNPKGFISHRSTIFHPDIRLGANVYVGDQVTIFRARGGGAVELGDRVVILRDTIIETGEGGCLTIGADTYIHPRCQLNAYKASIQIGRNVLIAANCAFYSHNHGIAPHTLIRLQPLETKGNIEVGDDTWLGTGVIVLSGVRIGRGAVIGAGSVVVQDIPDGAIAVGVPASVVKMREGAHEIRI